MIFDEWNLNKKDTVPLIFLLIFSLLLTLKMMHFSMSGRISNPDVALYLLTSLKYAGLDTFNIVNPEEIFYTPIISFLSSLFFRLGFVDKNAIIFTTSFFSLLGYFGLYILLKNRFNPILSLTGVLIYASLPIIIINATRGMIDVPAISIFIWILVFAIIAIDKNPKYFLIVFPLLIIGFFTKYIVGFAFPLILFYYIMKRDIITEIKCLITNKELFKIKFINFLHSKEFKYLFLSIIISLIIALLICKTLILDFGGHLSFFEQSINTFNHHATSSSGIDYNIDKSYYFDHFAQIIFESHEYSFILTELLVMIFLFGLVINIKKNYNIIKTNKKQLFSSNYDKISILICIVLIFISFFMFITFSNHLASNVCLLISFILLYSKLNEYYPKDNKLAIDFLFLSYFLVNFIFISTYPIKVPRYSLQVIPPIICIEIWSLDAIINYSNNRIRNLKIDKILPSILIIVCLIFTISFINDPMSFDNTNEIYRDVYDHDFKNDLIDACNFIINDTPNYHNKTFSTDYHHSRLIRWYLNVNISVIDTDNSLADYDEVDYIILKQNKTFKNYENVYHKGNFYVYRISKTL